MTSLPQRVAALLCLCCACVLAAAVEAPLDRRSSGEARFSVAPRLQVVGGATEVSFTLAAASDVTVVVVDAKGLVLRHLAAGLLGPNAPAPLVKGSLSQTLVWDGNDDAGKPAVGAAAIRVGAGSVAKLEQLAGFNPYNLPNIVSLTVGAKGELYVLMSASYRGETEMRVFSREGKYLRTIMPYPAETPKSRLGGIGRIELQDESLPVLLNGVVRSTYPLINGMRQQNAVFSKGHLVLMSAIGTLSEQGSPRHLLALHPEGGAPEGMEFVGPCMRKPGGFLGGSGEGGVGVFDHLTASPAGDVIYVTLNPFSRFWGPKAGRHGVTRVAWSDKLADHRLFVGSEEPGSDDAHLNTPAGIATDAAGNLYVCDWGNDRVMVYSPAAALLGKFAVKQPQQIAVHPASGAIYVSSCAQKTSWSRLWSDEATMRKFSAFAKGPPQELASIVLKNVDLMALDASAAPARLWVSGAKGLYPLDDTGAAFAAGPSISTITGVGHPWYLAADGARNRVYYYERLTHGGNPRIAMLDLVSGERRDCLDGSDVVLDRDGNIHVYNSRDAITRFDPERKPLPFPALGSHILKTKGARNYGPNLGMPGFAVSPRGAIHVLRASNYGNGDAYGSRLDVYDADGKLAKENLLDGMGYGDAGIGVDAAGGIYVGSNLKSLQRPFPAAFMDKVPAKGWAFWPAERPAPWCYPHLNSYLFYWGSVFKFGPEGGAFYGMHPWVLRDAKYQRKATDDIANAPPGADTFRSAYLNFDVKVAGAQWRYMGFGILPSSGDGLTPDPGCICHNSRFAVDPAGRVFVPDPFSFSVQMIDANGNQIARIGRYGNADSAGPGSRLPTPEIPFGSPTAVSYSHGRIFVSDSLNRRIAVIALAHQAEATLAITR